jgi:hypothetical protein
MVPPAKLLPLPGMATAAEEVGLTTEDDVADRYDTFMEEEPNTFDSKAPGKLSQWILLRSGSLQE